MSLDMGSPWSKDRHVRQLLSAKGNSWGVIHCEPSEATLLIAGRIKTSVLWGGDEERNPGCNLPQYVPVQFWKFNEIMYVAGL